MANSPEEHVGSKIRGLRRRAMLTISQLAELADLDVSFLNHLELGKRNPTLATLRKLSKALDIRVDALIKGDRPQKDDVDYQILTQVRALLHGRTQAQRADILAILKQLHDIERVRALRRLIRR